MSTSMSGDLGRSSPCSSNNTPPPSVQDTTTVVNGAPVTHETFTGAAAPLRQKKRKLSTNSDDTGNDEEEHVHHNYNGYGYGCSSSSSPCGCQCHVIPRCCGCSRLDSYPKGYRFCPKDDELLFYYLLKKVKKEELPENRIFEVNIYKDGPEVITEKYLKANEVEWYFFSERERKYPNGERPKRKAGNGYWKATGPDKVFKKNGRKIGAKKSLVFYIGKSPHGDKTDWMMQEYVLKGHQHHRTDKLDMKLDDYVLCKIYKKHEKGGGSKKAEDDAPQQVAVAPAPAPPTTTSARVLSNPQVAVTNARVLLNQVAAPAPAPAPTTSARVENYVVDQQNHDMHHQNMLRFTSYDPPAPAPAAAHSGFSMNRMRGGGFPQASSTPPPPPSFVNQNQNQNQNQNHPCLSRYLPNPNPNPNPNPAVLLAFESGQQSVGYQQQQQSFRSHNRSVLPIPPPRSVARPPAAAAMGYYQQHSFNTTILPNLLLHQHGYQHHPFIQPAAGHGHGPGPGPFLHPPHYTSSVAVAPSDDQSYLQLDPGSRVESYWDATNSNLPTPEDDGNDMGIGLQDLVDINGNWDIHSLQNEMNNHDQTPRDSLSKHDDDDEENTDTD